MEKIVPFKKDIMFETNLAEITSISLEHTLHLEKDNLITGEFIVSGEYKMTDTSVNTDAFSFNLPFDISIDDKYILDNVIVDIDDFYYEIINSNTLSVNISVKLAKLVEKPLIEKENIIINDLEEKIINNININNNDFSGINIDNSLESLVRKEEEVKMNKEDLYSSTLDEEREKVVEEEINETSTKIRSLFDSIDDSRETYTTYKVYIIREGDTLELITQKYCVSKDELEKYNDLKEIKIGDKLIIPALVNARD